MHSDPAKVWSGHSYFRSRALVIRIGTALRTIKQVGYLCDFVYSLQ